MLIVVVLTVGCGADQELSSAAAPASPAAVSARAPVAIPNPKFVACRTASRMIVDYRFATRPTWPVLLLTSAKSAGSRYPPLTVRTEIWKRSGRVNQPLGLGGAPWHVLVSVRGPGGRSSTIKRQLQPCP